jgi:hypothetical protein
MRIKNYPLEDLLTATEERFIFIEGGWKVLVDKLYDKVKDKVYLNIELFRVDRVDNFYKCYIRNNNKEYIVETKNLIFCGDLSIKNIQFNNIDMNILNSIGSFLLN